MAQILCIVDIHWKGTGAPPVPKLDACDLVVIGGDITNFGGVEVARRYISAIKKAGKPVLAVCGNCDQPSIEDYLRAEAIDLDRTCRVAAGVRFLGLSGGLPFGGCPYERTEADYDECLDELYSNPASTRPFDGPTILVSHQPPHGVVCDCPRPDLHVGSTAIRRAVERFQPSLVFSGHIHEGRGVDRIGATEVVNPGPAFQGHWVQIEVDKGGIARVVLD